MEADASPFLSYLRSIRELHIICINSDFTENSWKMALFNYEHVFVFFSFEVYKLNMTIKNFQNTHSKQISIYENGKEF